MNWYQLVSSICGEVKSFLDAAVMDGPKARIHTQINFEAVGQLLLFGGCRRRRIVQEPPTATVSGCEGASPLLAMRTYEQGNFW